MPKLVETIKGDGFTTKTFVREGLHTDYYTEVTMDDGTKADVTRCSSLGEARAEGLAVANSLKK